MAKEKKLGLKYKKTDFSNWYNNVLSYTQFVDDRYPIKGVNVWMPYGYKALSLLMNKVRNLLNETGHHETYFPMFVPLSIFSKEKDFLEGFSGETLRITKIGRRNLNEELVVRPTSETIIYPMFSLWIRSWRDLPLKIYQICPIFRWETKMTKPMLRVREIISFKEAHTAHATKEEAENQVKEAVKIYSNIFNFLKLPYIVLKSPEWDTFAGALFNYDHITIMPDGKSLELGSSICLGQKFSKTYNIKFKDKNENDQYVWQTCYGISERALGGALALAGDDKGLRLISEIAPIQIIIIPIGTEKNILNKCEELKKKLKEKYRVDVDLSDNTPGWKFNDWELKGVPIRIEIGKKELKNKTLTLARRDNGKKSVIKDVDLIRKIDSLLKDIDKNIYQESIQFFKSMITICKNVSDAEDILKKKGGIVKLLWCGSTSCGKKLSDILPGQALGFDENEKVKGNCVDCKKAAKHYLYFARTY